MKSTLKRTIRSISAAAMLTVFALPVMAANPEIIDTLEPTKVAVGEPAQLTVTITGGSEEQPAPPAVNGLGIIPMGQSSELQSINGVTTSSSSQTYLVTAKRAGRYTIPALKIGNGNSGEVTRPIVLQVTGASAGVGSAAVPDANPSSAAPLPTPNVAGADDDQNVSSNGQQAFLRLVTPRQQLHVGELVPVQIKAYFRDGLQATINGVPSLSSDAFTLNSLDDKPSQTQEDVEGQTYAVLTWTTALSAVKAGNYSLKLEMPVTVTVTERARQRHSDPNDPFDNSFFDNFFGNSVEKQITLTSKADDENVVALPSANRPADFNGAVGQFTVATEASPDHVNAGDPITLRMSITGRGNFDRISTNLLNNSANWKTYKPVARFAPGDSVGLEGTKTFEQAVVPLQSGQVQLPPLSFSYFDPETSGYVTRSTKPIAISVTPVANSPTAAIAASAAASPNNSGGDQPQFFSNRVEAGAFVSTLRPLFLQPWFLIANALTWCCCGAIFFFVRRRAQLASDPAVARARRAEQAIHDQLAAMDSAMQHAETAAFFASARRALQERLGERWHLLPETITLSEINARLNGHGDGIRPVFQMADQVAYSHEALPASDLAGWKRIVTEELRELEAL